jgi:cell division septation protein DedD
MATYHREVYQPSFEEAPTYDLQDEEVEDARARLPLLIVIALLVLAAFTGVVWLAYNQGVARARVEEPVMIAAPEGPVRVAPDDVQTDPFTGLKVYGAPVSPDEEAQSSTLARTAPLTPPAALAPAPLRSSDTAAPAPRIAEAAPQVPAPPKAAPVPPKAAPVRPAPPAAIVTAAPPAATPPAPAPATEQATPAAPSAIAGPAVLQIGSYPNEALANDAWQVFKTRYGEVVGDLKNEVRVANLGEKGTWYRLRVGPFSDKAAAVAACDKLKAAGGTCLVTVP